MRYFILLAYNGTDFHGSQTQPNAISVQQTLEQAMTTILRCPISLVFAGRTDAGVHATQMYAHFDLPSPDGYDTLAATTRAAHYDNDNQAPLDKRSGLDLLEPLALSPSQPLATLVASLSSSHPTSPLQGESEGAPTSPLQGGPEGAISRLNSLLPPTIAVSAIFPVPPDAHARFSATSRTYEYRVTTAKDPFRTSLVTRVAPGLDFDAMNEAAQLLLGTHDFASFCKVHTDVKTTICTVTLAEWVPAGPNSYTFIITADRFLRNMVRAIVGTLLDIGRAKLTKNDLQHIMNLHNRCAAGQSAPASGLYLVNIEYDNILRGVAATGKALV